MHDEGYADPAEVERYLRSMFDAMFEGIQLLDAEGRYIYLNETAAKHGRRSRDELIGLSMVEAYPGIEQTEMYALLERCRRDREPGHMVNRFTYPDGEDAWFDLRVSPTPEGGLLVLSIDVTERRAADEMLHQSQKMQAVGRLAGGVAHDFNNVLSVITSYADVILSRLGDDDRFRRELTEIKRASAHAADLTRQLLAFSRKRVLQPEILDVNEVLRELEGMLRRVIGEDIELSIRGTQSPHPVRIDPGHVQQILMNLVINARDAMPDGGTLTVETANVELPALPAGESGGESDGVAGPHLVLSVRDTGVGMDAATRERVFEPFFTTKELGRGTGLGLATIYGIVSQAGGRIIVESEPGDGATFRVFLPRAERAGSDAAPAPLRSPRRPAGGTVLVLEDDSAVRGVVRAVLDMVGYSVLEADTVEEALALIRSRDQEIALLLTDLVLPGMDGETFARQALDERPGLRVLYMSGYPAAPGEAADTFQPHAPFIEKPFTAAQLQGAVARALA